MEIEIASDETRLINAERMEKENEMPQKVRSDKNGRKKNN